MRVETGLGGVYLHLVRRVKCAKWGIVCRLLGLLGLGALAGFLVVGVGV